MSALGALEARVHETAHVTRLVVLHLAESSALGAKIVVAFDERAFEVANLENLHRLETTPELARPRHLHRDATTRKERCLSPTNLEGANCPSIEALTTKLNV